MAKTYKTSVLSVFDENGNKISIPAIKGENGKDGAVVVVKNEAENPIVEPDENGIFPIDTDTWYFAESTANVIGTHAQGIEYVIVLYGESKSVLHSQNIAAWARGAYTVGDYGIYAVGNMNCTYGGNRVFKVKITDAAVKYAKITSANASVPLKGIYRGMIPQAELDTADIFNGYLDAVSAAEFERKMRNHNGKYKKFKGIYRRELDGDIVLMINTPYGYPSGNDTATHIYEYYEGEAGDYWLYMYDDPTTLDCGIAYKGCIVFFDGTILSVDKNPFLHEGNMRQYDHYDVCIVGGGSAGFAAAYALKDSGHKVCLVEMLDSLGGTNLNGGVLHQIASPIGNWYKELCKAEYDDLGFVFETSTHSITSADETETDFDKLWRGSMVNHDKSNMGNLCLLNPYRFRKVYHEAIADTVNVLYNRRVVDSKVVNGKITYAVFENTLTGGRETISAEYFIDCTADLYLLRCNQTLNTDFFIGSDGADLYDESAYKSGATANKYEINTLEQGYIRHGTTNYAMCYSNNRIKRFETDRTKFPSATGGGWGGVNARFGVPLISPRYWEYNTNLNLINNYGNSYGQFISPGVYGKMSVQEFVDEGYDHSRAVGIKKAMQHYRVHGGLVFAGVTDMLSIREGYRMKCDYMLTQTDIETKITSADLADKHIIALSSWYCDIHNPSSLNKDNVTPAWLNGIPYEALVPSCYTNALVACRGLGASHVGAAAFRLTRTMLAIGYAAGKAIKQARDGWLDDVRDIDISTLQTDIEIADLLTDIETNILTTEDDEPEVPEKTLTGITATYTGGEVAVGTAVTALTGIIVTATYSDSTSEAVTGYTLSGTIAEGNNTITVSYGGNTTTFTVVGVAESGIVDNIPTENAVLKFTRNGWNQPYNDSTEWVADIPANTAITKANYSAGEGYLFPYGGTSIQNEFETGFKFTDNYTIGGRVKLVAGELIANEQCICTLNLASANKANAVPRVYLALNKNGSLVARVQNETSLLYNGYGVDSGLTLSDTEPTYVNVILVHESGKVVRVYVNGLEKVNVSYTGEIADALTKIYFPAHMGSQIKVTSLIYQAFFAYNKALTAEEAVALNTALDEMYPITPSESEAVSLMMEHDYITGDTINGNPQTYISWVADNTYSLHYQVAANPKGIQETTMYTINRMANATGNNRLPDICYNADGTADITIGTAYKCHTYTPTIGDWITLVFTATEGKNAKVYINGELVKDEVTTQTAFLYIGEEIRPIQQMIRNDLPICCTGRIEIYRGDNHDLHKA